MNNRELPKFKTLENRTRWNKIFDTHPELAAAIMEVIKDSSGMSDFHVATDRSYTVNGMDQIGGSSIQIEHTISLICDRESEYRKFDIDEISIRKSQHLLHSIEDEQPYEEFINQPIDLKTHGFTKYKDLNNY